jgi:rhodanese-related sulfurtransferase
MFTWKLYPMLFFMFLFALPLFGQSFAYQTLLKGLYDSSFPVLKPEQITDLNKYQVLDAREKEEYGVSHLPKALWVGHDTFSLKSVASLDKNKPVLIYCTVGARSEQIGKMLQKEGFSKVFNLYGGILHWVNEGRQVVVQGKPTLRVHTYSRSWGFWLNRGEKVY